MIYTEKKTLNGWEYFNEDLYGETTIKSKNKLAPNTLDEIVCKLVMEKKIKKGHTDGIKFEAKFKNQWEEINIKKYETNKSLLQRFFGAFKKKKNRKEIV